LARITERVVLCGNVDKKIKNYSNKCTKALNEASQDIQLAVTDFIMSLEVTSDQTETASWLYEYFPNVEIVQRMTLEYMKSNLKLAAGPFFAGDNVELQDLNNMMDESKESLKKSLSSLVVDDNKFVLGLEALAHFVLGRHGQILPKFNVIDIFTRIENQTEIWKILHMTNTEDMLNALLAVDLSRNFYPTNTQWDYFHDALSSHAWSSKRYLEFDRVYQTIVQDLKEFFSFEISLSDETCSYTSDNACKEQEIREFWGKKQQHTL